MPLVSVIIPAYNSGHYLDEAVQSVIAQTFADWECIVVDDGSTEDLSRVGKMDSRVRLIRQPNGGGAVARNNGILNSSGEYIALLDHDDLWLERKLELQVAAMQSAEECGLCFTAFDIVGPHGGPVGPGWAKPMRTHSDYLAEPGGPMPSATVIRRSCIARAGLFTAGLGVADYEMFLRASRVAPMLFLRETLALYRVHGHNQTNNYEAIYRDARTILTNCISGAKGRRDRPSLVAAATGLRKLRRTYGAQAFDAARRQVRAGDIAGSLPHIARAVVRSPLFTVRSLLRFPFHRASDGAGD